MNKFVFLTSRPESGPHKTMSGMVAFRKDAISAVQDEGEENTAVYLQSGTCFQVEESRREIVDLIDDYEYESVNAVLMREAPNLLAACEAAEHWLQEEAASPNPGSTRPDEILRVLRRAIKAAKKEVP